MNSRILVLLLAVSVLAYIGLNIKSCRERQRLTGLVEASRDSARIWQDEAGRWHATATAQQVTKADLQQLLQQESQQIRQDFDVKLKNVTGLLRAQTATSSTIIMPRDSTSTIIIRNADGSDTASFAYTDQWAEITARLDSRHLTMSYLVRDSLAFVTSWKRTGLFRPKRLEVHGISYNPNTRITGLDNITVTAPVSRWSAGVFAGYGISPGTPPGVVAGVGIQYRLVSW